MQRAASVFLAVGFVVVMLTVWAFARPATPKKTTKSAGGLLKKVEEPAGPSPFMVPVILGELGLVGLALYLAYRRSLTESDDGSPKTRCPQCSMKLRYRPSMAGREGKCPSCKHVFAFPAVAV